MDGVEVALACYFCLNLFLILAWTLVSSKFALCGVLHVILQPRKKLDPKLDPDVEVMALLQDGCAQCSTAPYRRVGPNSTVLDRMFR